MHASLRHTGLVQHLSQNRIGYNENDVVKPYPKILLVPQWLDRILKRAVITYHDFFELIEQPWGKDNKLTQYFTQDNINELCAINASALFAQTFLGHHHNQTNFLIPSIGLDQIEQVASAAFERLGKPAAIKTDELWMYKIISPKQYHYAVILKEDCAAQPGEFDQIDKKLVRDLIMQLCEHYEYHEVAALPIFGTYFANLK